MRYQFSSATAAGDVITLTSTDDLVIAPNILVGSEGEDGVQGNGSDHDVQVYGVVSGASAGVYLGTDPTLHGNNIVRVMAGGATYGSGYGVLLYGIGNAVINHGSISADSYGVFLVGRNTAGTITTITNHGTITGYDGVRMSGEALRLFNTGTIEAYSVLNGNAVVASQFADIVTNRGTLIGNVRLGDGVDSYDGRGGFVEDGTVFGDGGNDTFFVGSGFEIIDGGAGIDTLDFNGASGVRVSLIDDTSTGVAAGDTFFGIERLFGSAGNDTLIGDGLANTLLGRGGADRLEGGLGNDTYVLGTEATGVDTIFDTGGFDTITSGISRDLSAYATIENLTLAGTDAVNGTGNALANLIIGSTVANLLRGGAGNDTLRGGLGSDRLYGDANDDRFQFLTTADSAVGAARDVIYDLDDFGNDLIDLSLMAGVDTYIGTQAFTAVGQVRVQQQGADVLVQINTVGTTGAESEILIAGATIGTGAGQVDITDFLL